MTDPLTNIPNRKAFDEAMRMALAAVAEGENVALMMCDIVNFITNASWKARCKGWKAFGVVGKVGDCDEPLM